MSECVQAEPTIEREAMHGWFELSYAAYLVVPRTVIQSMPDEWQVRLRDCLVEADALFGYASAPSYWVRACDVRGKFLADPYRDYERGRRRLVPVPPNEPGPDIKAADWTGVADPYNPGLDYPTAWAIQKECPHLEHHPRCSSRPGWGMLCDCGAVLREAQRRATVPAPTLEAPHADAHQS